MSKSELVGPPGSKEIERSAEAGLDVRLGRALMERPWAKGVSRVGKSDLPAGGTWHSPRAPEAEMTDHLEYGKGDQAGAGSDNARNGTSAKAVLTKVGPVELAIAEHAPGVLGHDMRDEAAGPVPW